MSAISHGWQPKGKAASIPVRVAREFHVADTGKKYGHQKPENRRKVNHT